MVIDATRVLREAEVLQSIKAAKDALTRGHFDGVLLHLDTAMTYMTCDHSVILAGVGHANMSTDEAPRGTGSVTETGG